MFRSIGFIEENPNLQFLRLLQRDCHVLIQNLLGEGLWDDQAWCTWCRPKDVCTDPSLGVFGPNNDLQTNPKTILANIFFFDETNSSRWGEIVGGLLGMGETSKQPADKSVDPFPPPPPSSLAHFFLYEFWCVTIFLIYHKNSLTNESNRSSQNKQSI